jgi:hypothetical protein
VLACLVNMAADEAHEQLATLQQASQRERARELAGSSSDRSLFNLIGSPSVAETHWRVFWLPSPGGRGAFIAPPQPARAP